MQQLVKTFTVALVGNPNCGKSSIFNSLTGLKQRIGNFPGVTVEKKVGQLHTSSERSVDILDLPGTYSLYPNSTDEKIVVQTLTNPLDDNFPDAIVYIADVTKLEKHFLLLSQIKDLGIPVILVLNMLDIAEREGMEINTDKLSKTYDIPVVVVSSRTGKNMDELPIVVDQLIQQKTAQSSEFSFYAPTSEEKKLVEQVKELFPDMIFNDYQALLIAHHGAWLPYLSEEEKNKIAELTESSAFNSLRNQVEETMKRFDNFTPTILQAIKKKEQKEERLTSIADNILTNSYLGPVIFFGLMLLVFQAIFSWATYPMDAIEGIFGWLGDGVRNLLPAGWVSDLITDGLLAGLGGILVFIPQIAILFFLISILEEIGYMARAAFLFDRLMQFFGMNGKSIVALISGGACAIPAIMSTRTISNWKERLVTIMVTPLISCSARIPVYAVLIGFVVPAQTVWGIFNLQAIAFMGLYILGILAALISALVFKLILKNDERSFLILELPEYRWPVFRNVWTTVWEKVKSFVVEAGQVILFISVILWVLAYFGPGNEMVEAEAQARQTARLQNLDEQATNNLIASRQLEASYVGHIGKFIEPAIEPLGFDWKIGIALVTSFAAREVFVGTMATIYSIGSADNHTGIKQKMAAEVNPKTGQPIYTVATSMSLLIFYAFAMQCMSTLAVVKKETLSWKWPIIQFVFMSVLAYFSSWLAFVLLS